MQFSTQYFEKRKQAQLPKLVQRKIKVRKCQIFHSYSSSSVVLKLELTSTKN